MKFSALRMSVIDVEASRDWYARFFGVPPIEDLPGYVSFRFNECCLELTVADAKSPFSKGGSVGYWRVEAFDEFVARATENGARLYRGPLFVPEIGRRIAQLEDPFGNVIGIEG